MTTEELLRETLLELAEAAPTGAVWPQVARRHHRRGVATAIVASVALGAAGTGAAVALRPTHASVRETISTQPSVTARPTPTSKARTHVNIPETIRLLTQLFRTGSIGTSAFAPLGSTPQARAARSAAHEHALALVAGNRDLIAFTPGEPRLPGRVTSEAIAGSVGAASPHQFKVLAIVIVNDHGRTLFESFAERLGTQLTVSAPRAGLPSPVNISLTSEHGGAFVGTISYGDGTTTHPASCGSARSGALSHRWSRPGTYPVDFTVQTDCGLHASRYSFRTQIQVLP